MIRSLALTTLFCFVASSNVVAQEKSVRPGINDSFRDPNVSEYIEKFEIESREVFSDRPSTVIEDSHQSRENALVCEDALSVVPSRWLVQSRQVVRPSLARQSLVLPLCSGDGKLLSLLRVMERENEAPAERDFPADRPQLSSKTHISREKTPWFARTRSAWCLLVG